MDGGDAEGAGEEFVGGAEGHGGHDVALPECMFIAIHKKPNAAS